MFGDFGFNGSFGRFGTSSGGGSAPSGIEPVSVNARGVLFTMASDPGTLTIDQSETIVRTGYTAAGGTTPTTWNEPVVIRSRARVAGTASGAASFRATEYVSSKVIMAGDTLLGRSITNNSTRTAPLIEHRWVTRGNYTVDDGDTSCAAFATSTNRNGTPIAFVVFKWEDSALASVTTTVTAPTKRTCALTGFVGQVYEGTAPAGFAALADGQIRKTYTAYGHYGQVITSDVTPSTYYGSEPYPQFIRKKAGFLPVYIYFSATGVDVGGVASTTAATARAAPWALTTTAYNNARIAARAANLAANGWDALDGTIMRLRGDGSGTADIGVWTNASTSTQNCFIGGVTIEADPDEYTSYKPSVTFNNWAMRTGGSTVPGATQGWLVQNVKVQRQAASSNSTFASASGQIAELRFKNCIYDGGAVTASAWPCATGRVVFEDCELTGFTSSSGSHLLGTSTTFIIGFIGCLNTNMNQMAVASNYVMGSNIANARFTTNLTAALRHGIFFDASFGMASLVTGTATYATADINITATRGQLFRNSLIEMLTASEASRYGGFSADAGTNDLNTVAFHNCAFPGSVGDGVLAGANRVNFAYVDAAVDARVHNWVNMVGTVPMMTANKGDNFSGVAASYDGWSEFGNGVGSAGNFLSRIQPNADFSPDYYGIGSFQPSSGATETLPGFTAPQVPTVMGGSNGAGGGTYTFAPGAAAIGAVSYIPEVLWDCMGNDLPAGVVRTTPGPYAGLYA